MPEGVANPPDYWRILTTVVPPEKGLPHLREVRISGVKGSATRQAFSVNSYKDSPLEDFILKNFNITARTAGTIQNASHWQFEDVTIQAEDKSKVVVKDSVKVTGLE
jgi:hypothetical protein